MSSGLCSQGSQSRSSLHGPSGTWCGFAISLVPVFPRATSITQSPNRAMPGPCGAMYQHLPRGGWCITRAVTSFKPMGRSNSKGLAPHGCFGLRLLSMLKWSIPTASARLRPAGRGEPFAAWSGRHTGIRKASRAVSVHATTSNNPNGRSRSPSRVGSMGSCCRIGPSGMAWCSTWCSGRLSAEAGSFFLNVRAGVFGTGAAAVARVGMTVLG